MVYTTSHEYAELLEGYIYLYQSCRNNKSFVFVSLHDESYKSFYDYILEILLILSESFSGLFKTGKIQSSTIVGILQSSVEKQDIEVWKKYHCPFTKYSFINSKPIEYLVFPDAVDKFIKYDSILSRSTDDLNHDIVLLGEENGCKWIITLSVLKFCKAVKLIDNFSI